MKIGTYLKQLLLLGKRRKLCLTPSPEKQEALEFLMDAGCSCHFPGNPEFIVGMSELARMESSQDAGGTGKEDLVSAMHCRASLTNAQRAAQNSGRKYWFTDRYEQLYIPKLAGHADPMVHVYYKALGMGIDGPTDIGGAGGVIGAEGDVGHIMAPGDISDIGDIC